MSNAGQFVKGEKRPKQGQGRPPGVPNKVTIEFRETVRKLLEDNAENYARWLAQVADGHGDEKPDPGRALDLTAKLAEYAAPKLARTEIDQNVKASVELHVFEIEKGG